eukprot:symbB.v1.2.014337.t1/scaffold1047.1/size141927/3
MSPSRFHPGAMSLQKAETLSQLSDISTEMVHSDVEPSVRPPASDEESETCACAEERSNFFHLIVKKTFLHMDDGQSLRQKDRELRRVKSETNLAFREDEVYELEKIQGFGALPKNSSTPQPNRISANQKRASQSGRVSEERTTVMLRNLPNNYTREMFLVMLDENGLKGQYDFAYLPCDFQRRANLGYAFVNLVDSEAVESLWRIFHGFSAWALPSSKVCQVSWSGPHQGFKAHLERYRNSPVMHESVPDEYKPVIFSNGVRKAFPKPTRKVKAPLRN